MADDIEDAADDAVPSLQKQRGRPFAPGQSGNPNGKPRGARHPAFIALDAIGQQGAEEVLQAVVNQAKEGDMRAAEILLRRVWPERKGKPIRIDLPEVNSAADLVPAMARVSAAMACGELSPEEAQAVTAVLEGQRKVIETRDLDARLRRMEEEEGLRSRPRA